MLRNYQLAMVSCYLDAIEYIDNQPTDVSTVIQTGLLSPFIQHS